MLLTRFGVPFLALYGLISALFVPGATFQEVVASLNRENITTTAADDSLRSSLSQLQKMNLLSKLANDLRVQLDNYEPASRLKLLYERVLMLLSEPPKNRASVKKKDSREKESVDQNILLRISDIINKGPDVENITETAVTKAAVVAASIRGLNSSVDSTTNEDRYSDVMTEAVRAQGIRGYLRSLLGEVPQNTGYKTDKYYDGGYEYPCEDAYETSEDDEADDGYDYTRRKFVTWSLAGNTLYPRKSPDDFAGATKNSSIDALGNVNIIENGASRTSTCFSVFIIVLVTVMLSA